MEATVADFELIVREESCWKAEGNMRKLETVSLGSRSGVAGRSIREGHTQSLSGARIEWQLLSSTIAFGLSHCKDLSVSAVAST